MSYLIRRKRRGRAHIATFDRLGDITGLALCGSAGFDISSNVPGGRRICKHCLRAAARPGLT